MISPAEASAKVGDTIEWINKDIFAHTATARNGDWDVTLPPKKTGTLGFEEGRHGRLLLPLPSQHEGDAHGHALARHDNMTGISPVASSRLERTKKGFGSSASWRPVLATSRSHCHSLCSFRNAGTRHRVRCAEAVATPFSSHHTLFPSHPAQAGCPVRRGFGDRIEMPRLTGSSAFADDDRRITDRRQCESGIMPM